MKKKGTAAQSRVNKAALDQGYPLRSHGGKTRVVPEPPVGNRASMSKQQRDRLKQQGALRNE